MASENLRRRAAQGAGAKRPMKRSTIIGGLALLTVVSLGIATLAIIRRQRAEASLVELNRIRMASPGLPARPLFIANNDQADTPATPTPASAAPASENTPSRKWPPRPDVGTLLAAHPELQAAHRQAVNGRLHQTYDRLFTRLGMSAAQIEQALAVLARDAEDELDLAMTAQTLQLPKDDPSLVQFRRGEKSDTEVQLESLLGAQGMQAWRDYNRALSMQSTAEDVASLALASDTPMTGAQTEQLIRVMAEANAAYRAGGRPEWSSTDWAEVLRQAPTFLAPAQVVALQAKIQQTRAAALHSQFYASRPHR